MEKWVDGQIELHGPTDSYIGRHIHGETDRQTDRQTDTQVDT